MKISVIEIKLGHFMLNKSQDTGLFQKFIEPLGNKNFLIEVEWNKQFLQITRYSNIHSLEDKVQMFKKLFTVESQGDDHIKIENLQNKRLANKLMEAVIEIKRRVNSVYYFNSLTMINGEEFRKNFDKKQFKFNESENIIQSLKVYFKIDKEFEIYLLYCTDLKLNPNKIKQSNQKTTNIAEIDNSVFFTKIYFCKEMLNGRISLENSKTKNKVDLEGHSLCPSCHFYVSKKSLNSISYRLIIKNSENSQLFNTFKSYEEEIPKVLRNIIEKELETETDNDIQIKVKEIYHNAKKSTEYLDRRVDLCYDCYLENTCKLIAKNKIFKNNNIQSKYFGKSRNIKMKLKNNYLSNDDKMEFRKFEILLDIDEKDLKSKEQYDRESVKTEDQINTRNFTKLKKSYPLKTQVKFQRMNTNFFAKKTSSNDINAKKKDSNPKCQTNPLNKNINNFHVQSKIPKDLFNSYSIEKKTYFGNAQPMVKYFKNKEKIIQILKSMSNPVKEKIFVKRTFNKSKTISSKEASEISNEFNLSRQNSKKITSLNKDKLADNENETFIERKGEFNKFMTIGITNNKDIYHHRNTINSTSGTIQRSITFNSNKTNKTNLVESKMINEENNVIDEEKDSSFNKESELEKDKSELNKIFPIILAKSRNINTSFQTEKKFVTHDYDLNQMSSFIKELKKTIKK